MNIADRREAELKIAGQVAALIGTSRRQVLDQTNNGTDQVKMESLLAAHQAKLADNPVRTGSQKAYDSITRSTTNYQPINLRGLF